MFERIGKCNESSDTLRAEGNQLYARKMFYDALLKYNESLCAAESESENMGLAFANRSAVYFEMKLYDKCLNNIDLAKENHYPNKNLEILEKRKAKCLEMTKQLKEEFSTVLNFKLSYPPNKKLPFIVDCLELKTNKEFGRHIVTNKTLKVGDVLVIEKPFVEIIQTSFLYTRCSNCFNDNMMDLIPCMTCNGAMFCTSQCREIAFKNFHKYECQLVNLISSSLLTPTMRMALRTLFVALSIFEGSIEDLEKFLHENTDCRTIFDLEDFNDMKQRFLAVNSLISSSDIEVNASIFEEIFHVVPQLKSMWTVHGQFIESFLRKQTQIGILNYHEIFSWPLKKGGFLDNDITAFKGSLAYQRGVVGTGFGSYSFTSLLNHSCAPNICRIHNNNEIILIVQRPIAKGEQLFDNYGYCFTNVSKDCRQQALLKQYRFKCNCRACVDNWPLLPSLRVLDKACLNKAKKACREVSSACLSKKKAHEKYKDLCEVIEKNSKNYPTLEVCSLMESSFAYLEMTLKPLLQFP
ncbi:CLUMA_CG019150, isoform A [Clunio marinus]|uniref:CLUMA_CG019150, isoform A n=1 Tax=Clunio marinus TaxID=568069 RepID=A0A1J1J0G0_9DIPT|nr:CLUMA_CG019150, isoform A [Clunio marinus]